MLPKNFGTLKKRHLEYLEGRGFDAVKAMKQFRLVGTGRGAGEYSHRILFPIYYKGKLVSYHSRDITDKAYLKALACDSENEAVRHKEVLYNFDNISNVAVLSEAPLDAIKWGYDIGVATFGIKFTEQQIELLKTIPHLFVAFDSGPGEQIAQKQARRIADLCGIYRPVHVIDDLGCDPAELSDRRVKKIRREIFKIVNDSTC
jgi:DNA primase